MDEIKMRRCLTIPVFQPTNCSAEGIEKLIENTTWMLTRSKALFSSKSGNIYGNMDKMEKRKSVIVCRIDH